MKRAAKARLENASLLLAKELLGMAMDEEMPPAIRLAAIKDALDRAGLGARQALDLTHQMKKYETIFDGIDREALDGGPTVVEGSVVPPEWGDFDDGRTA